MDPALETRARAAALREFELARLVGDGDVAEGLMRLRIAERRAARRVPLPPHQVGAPEPVQDDGAQPSASRRRGRRAKRSSACSAPAAPAPPSDPPEPVPSSTACMPCMPQSQSSAADAAVAVTADADADAQPLTQALPPPPGLDAIIRSSSEAAHKRLHSPSPTPAVTSHPATPTAPAAKRQLVPPPPPLPPAPPSLPPSPPSSPPTSPPPRPRRPPCCNTLLLPRQLVVKPSPLPKPPPPPKPPSRPLVYICPSCPSIALLPPSCPHPFYSVSPAEPEYAQARSLFTNPPF